MKSKADTSDDDLDDAAISQQLQILALGATKEEAQDEQAEAALVKGAPKRAYERPVATPARSKGTEVQGLTTGPEDTTCASPPTKKTRKALTRQARPQPSKEL